MILESVAEEVRIEFLGVEEEMRRWCEEPGELWEVLVGMDKAWREMQMAASEKVEASEKEQEVEETEEIKEKVEVKDKEKEVEKLGEMLKGVRVSPEDEPMKSFLQRMKERGGNGKFGVFGPAVVNTGGNKDVEKDEGAKKGDGIKNDEKQTDEAEL